MCVDFDDCECMNGWSGTSCDIPNCAEVNNCNNKGQCIDYNICECFEGFDGVACDDILAPNEVTPTFEHSLYSVNISDSLPVGTEIITLYAIDTDPGRSGKVSYSLINGTDLFIIDSETGIISNKVAFTFVVDIMYYYLAVRVEDDGSPVLFSTTNVLFIILAENENCPVINDIEINSNVQENTEPGTVLAIVSAEDVDEGLNGQIVYSFSQAAGEIIDLFDIDPNNGTIRTKQQLFPGTFLIDVLVSDRGNPPCTEEIQVHVQVLMQTTMIPSTETSTTTNVAPTTISSTEKTTVESMTTIITDILSTAREFTSGKLKTTSREVPMTTDEFMTTVMTDKLSTVREFTSNRLQTTNREASMTTDELMTTILTDKLSTAREFTFDEFETTTREVTKTTMSEAFTSDVYKTTTESTPTEEQTEVTSDSLANAYATTSHLILEKGRLHCQSILISGLVLMFD